MDQSKPLKPDLGSNTAHGDVEVFPDTKGVQTARAFDLVEFLTEQGLSLATAESLTAGMLSAAIVDVSGASECFRGGVTTYQTPTKATVLHVDQKLLDKHGPVDPNVAKQMAKHVCSLFKADVAISTTGVAGPGPSDGHDAGTVYVGLYYARTQHSYVRQFHFKGNRESVRNQTVQAALKLALDKLIN